jgi:hypothetical protein
MEIAHGEELIVFHVTRTDDHASQEFADSFLSHSQLGLPPRGQSPEETHPLIYEGISAFDTKEAAIETAKRVRRAGGDIGGFVTEIRLNHALGAKYLRWGARGHLTLWCDPLKLAQSAVDTIPIGA